VGTGRRRVLVGAIVVGLALVAFALAPRIIERVAAGGEANRLGFAATAVRLFEEHPVTGSGPGTWVIERPRLTQPGEVDDYQPHAHDVYAQTLAELGLVGIAAGVVLLVSIGWLVLSGIRGPDPIRRRWAIATAVGAVYFLTHQVVDFWVDMPALLFAAALPVAYLDTTATRAVSIRRRTMPTRIGGRTLAIGAVTLAVGLTWLGFEDVRAIRYEALVARADAGEWTAAGPGLRELAGSDPEISAYVFTAGLAADRAGDHQGAAVDFEQVALRDDLPEAWLNLAAEQAATTDTASADTSLVNAYRLGSRRPAVAMAIGDLALRIGDAALARKAFGSAITWSPSLAADPWWSAEPARSAAFDATVASLIRHGGWEVALMTGDASRAETIAKTSGAPPEALGFIRGWAGDSAATDALLEQCRRRPFEVTLLLWCARLEHRAGKEATAVGIDYLATSQGGEAFLSGLELRVTTGAGLGIQQGGLPATAWGLYTYRRPTPADMLVPSLVHLEYV
jgi:tetratricopeptide (TPR) repeat protein